MAESALMVTEAQSPEKVALVLSSSMTM